MLSALLTVLLAAAPVPGTAYHVAGPGEIETQVPRWVLERGRAAGSDRRAAPNPQSLAETALYPMYDWPLQDVFPNGLVIVNYVDEDTTAGVKDYYGNPHAYDQHRGTDIGMFDFRASDRGEKILAAAPGVVTSVVYNLADCNSTLPSPDYGNWVFVDNLDGTSTYYFHMRKNSPAVSIGENVVRGQMLGLVASSGSSTLPHLHFEASSGYAGSPQERDPWHGPNNPLSSLWNSQLPYQGTAPLRILSVYPITLGEVGGDIYTNLTYTAMINKVSQPRVIGMNEPWIPFILQKQGNLGDTYTFEVRKPDNSLWVSYPDTLREKDKFDWLWYYVYWAPYVAPADTGLWTVRVTQGAGTLMQNSFRVGASTAFAPRFWPVDGRSFRVNGLIQKDTLRVSPLGGPVTYSLLNAPSWVTLTDSIVTLPAVSPQSHRNYFFQAVARDGLGLRDTLWYHVVDTTKSMNSITGVGDAPPELGSLGLTAPSPNPMRARTRFQFIAARSSRARLEVLNVSGQRIRSLHAPATVGGGLTSAEWDGLDEQGRHAPAGIYFVRLSTEDGSKVRKLVLLP